jgi:hypothetical protein
VFREGAWTGRRGVLGLRGVLFLGSACEEFDRILSELD